MKAPKPKRATRAKRIDREHAEQVALFRWRDMNVRRIPGLAYGFAIPNGAYLHGTDTQRAMQWARLESAGARQGVSDTFWPVARNGCHGLWIEMKAARPHGSAVSKRQRDWIKAMAAEGYRAVVCYGWEEAKVELERYFGSA